ncbi:MAG: glycosyltransferase family 4 protein [Planctomycetota bacterium]|nr:glycosyltransferase family 4 protein [Planctomycetota bacterium]
MTARIVHLTTVHRPDDVRIFHKECGSLLQAGYEVTLIAPGQADLTVARAGIRHVATGTVKHRRQRMLALQYRTLKRALALKADLYHFHDPEMMPTAVLLKLFGRRVIYDVHEDLPRQILTKHWIPRRLRGVVSRCAEIIENVGVRCYDGVVAATPKIASRFPVHKTSLVQNFPILGELAMPQTVPYAQRPWRIAYIGGMTAPRGLREVIAALAKLPDELPIRADLVGGFTPAAFEEELRAQPGWSRVDFGGFQPRSRVAEILSQARAGLVTFLPVPNHTEAQPNKLFEYMSAGIPVIASHFPLWREIVESANCGIVVDPANPDDIARAITWIFDHPREAAEMGARGQAAVQNRYHWGREAVTLLETYERLLGRTARKPHESPSEQQPESIRRAA